MDLLSTYTRSTVQEVSAHISLLGCYVPPNNRTCVCHAIFLPPPTSVLAEYPIWISSTCYTSRYAGRRNDAMDHCNQHESESYIGVDRHQSRKTECSPSLGRISVSIPLSGAYGTILHPASMG